MESPKIQSLQAAAYCIPTDAPEADGTLEWTGTTIVIVHAGAANRTGIGYSYTHAAAATLITQTLQTCVVGQPAFDIPRIWSDLRRRVRNIGRPGLCATAISAIDAALWDLKACLLEVPLVDLLGAARDGVSVYGSGGFTAYDDARLIRQLAGWTQQGFTRVKMKIGSDPQRATERVCAVREALGEQVQLFVDANGAFGAPQALRLAAELAGHGVTWFEEPVPSDDLRGLRTLRRRAPPGMDIAAGEYGYDEFDFQRLLDAGAVDVLQVDATRCCGLSGFLRADALAAARHTPLSSHCAPALHAAICCASANVRHMEYFHDHVRIEAMLFEGVPEPRDGTVQAQRDRPGCGFVLRRADAERFRA